MEKFKLIQINETFAPRDPFTEEFVELEAGDDNTMTCPTCKGHGVTGKVGDYVYCERCQGEGWVWVNN